MNVFLLLFALGTTEGIPLNLLRLGMNHCESSMHMHTTADLIRVVQVGRQSGPFLSSIHKHSTKRIVRILTSIKCPASDHALATPYMSNPPSPSVAGPPQVPGPVAGPPQIVDPVTGPPQPPSPSKSVLKHKRHIQGHLAHHFENGKSRNEGSESNAPALKLSAV